MPLTPHKKSVADSINALLLGVSQGQSVEVSDEVAEKLGKSVVDNFKRQLQSRELTNKIDSEDGKYIGASDLGNPCLRELWYKQRNKDYPPEDLLPHAKFKFMYGDLIESLLLALAECAGHEVTDEQAEIELPIEGTDWKILGRIDAKIDGVLTDAKSTSTFAYKKFESQETLANDDAFGYITQLSTYDAACGDDQHLPEFLVAGKELGHINTLQIHPTHPVDIQDRAREVVEAVTQSHPPRVLDTIPDGKSGNMKMCMKCSYCSRKSHCFPEARAFLYSGGKVVYLTEVKKLPRVPEIT